jgi:hypothetical protein
MKKMLGDLEIYSIYGNVYIINIIAKNQSSFKRGSPSLVGRGIANPMFARTRGFESHSPRYSLVFLHNPYRCKDFSFLSLGKREVKMR